MRLSHPQDLINEENESIFSLPEIHFELQAALNDSDKTFQDLGEIIGFDPALSGRLLKIVNSPFYGFPSRIETISHAISIIGMDQLTDLALSTMVIHQFRGIPNSLFNMEKFWRHSIACGVTARAIAEFRNEKNTERFYLAGILHDIGRLVIFKKEPALARDTFYRSKERQENIYLSEQKLMGFNHADVGRELLKAWKLPPRLVEAVGNHRRRWMTAAASPMGHHEAVQNSAYRLPDSPTPARVAVFAINLRMLKRFRWKRLLSTQPIILPTL